MAHRLFSKDKERRLTQEYLDYATIQELANREGCHYSTIHKIIKRHATPEQIAQARSRNVSASKTGVARNPETIEKMRQANLGPQLERICPTCETVFTTTPYDNHKFCSLPCYWASLSNHPEQVGQHSTCQICESNFYIRPARRNDPRRGKYCSRECYDVSQSLRRGPETPNWKNGATKEHQLIRTSKQYRDWRNDVLSRDNHTCQDCGATVNLEVHHIRPFHQYENLRFDLDNGLTLCIDCHAKVDSYRDRMVNGNQ